MECSFCENLFNQNLKHSTQSKFKSLQPAWNCILYNTTMSKSINPGGGIAMSGETKQCNNLLFKPTYADPA